MPTTVIDVDRVLTRPVGRQYGWQGTAYDVIPVVAPGTSSAPLFQTLNPLKASLCERAAATQQPVEIVWKDGRYGRDIVTVRLLPKPAQTEQVA